MDIIVKEANVYVDQNIPVYDGNRYMTIRLGVGLRADVPADQYDAGFRELHARAEVLLTGVLANARAEAQGRLEKMADQVAQENDLI